MSFKFIAGNLCLDFLNTVGARLPSGENLRDKFSRPADLLDWGRQAGIAGGPRMSTLHLAVPFREALYRIVVSLMEHRLPPQEDLHQLNRYVAEAEHHRSLVFSHGRLVPQWHDVNAPRLILWTVALSAAALFASDDLARIRQCPGDECGWLFLDTSRNHARRWCQMQICGNRAKVRRFRES